MWLDRLDWVAGRPVVRGPTTGVQPAPTIRIPWTPPEPRPQTPMAGRWRGQLDSGRFGGLNPHPPHAEHQGQVLALQALTQR